MAHDKRKQDMIEWVDWNADLLLPHKLICTGTTGKLIQETLDQSDTKAEHALEVIRLKSARLAETNNSVP